MSFDFHDRNAENDRARNVTRKDTFRVADFWKSGEPGEGFIITGGRQDERVWGLYHAIEDYIRRTQRPVILLHNTVGMDQTLRRHLKERFPCLHYENVGGILRNYMPFDGMGRENVVECIKNQSRCEGSAREQVGQYMNSFLAILEQYKKSHALTYLCDMAHSNDEELMRMAREAGVEAEARIGINTNNRTAATVAKEAIKALYQSFLPISNGQEGPWINIGRFLKQRTGARVLSLRIGASNPDRMLMALRDELALLGNEKFLLVLCDIHINQNNAFDRLIEDSSKRFAKAFCADDVYGMFDEESVKAFDTARSRIRKWMILKYTDAMAAERISSVFGKYMMKVTVKVTAPKKPFEIFKAVAPGHAKTEANILEPSEICSMNYKNAILYGHAQKELLFVTRQLHYGL